MRRRRTEQNTFTMSFLDMVSAGFGAAFFLFLIFASLPITPSGGMLGSTEYIDVELSWDNKDYLLELIVYPPDDREIRLGAPLINVEPLTGQVFYGDNQLTQIVNAWQGAFMTGASAYGDTQLSENNEQFLHFRAVNPCQGQWRFAINVNNRLSAKPYLKKTDVKQAIKISMRAYTASDNIKQQAIYTATTNKIEPIKKLTEFLSLSQKTLYTPIEWKTPEQITARSVIVKEPKVAVTIEHCRLN